jgi:hypothetical protein
MAKKNGNNQNVLGMLAHLLMLFAGFIPPLIFYLIYKEDKSNKFVAENARHALNFSISVIIYWICITVITIILTLITLGFFAFLSPIIFAALGIFMFVVIIIATVKSHKGEIYKYPLEIEFIK